MLGLNALAWWALSYCTAPCYTALLVWGLVACLLLLRHTTTRYRVLDVVSTSSRTILVESYGLLVVLST